MNRIIKVVKNAPTTAYASIRVLEGEEGFEELYKAYLHNAPPEGWKQGIHCAFEVGPDISYFKRNRRLLALRKKAFGNDRFTSRVSCLCDDVLTALDTETDRNKQWKSKNEEEDKKLLAEWNRVLTIADQMEID